MSTRVQIPMKPAAPARGLTPAPFGTLQRKCACGGSGSSGGECEGCKKKKLQRRATGGGPETAPPIVHDVLRSPGQSLDAATRAFFEPRFGHSFSRVRVHADGQAAESAASVNALAYTVGRDVVFGAGQYAPHFSSGQKLLAHELTHVVQQDRGRDHAAEPLGISQESRLENEAAAVGSSDHMQGQPSVHQAQGPSIQRQAAPGQTAPGQAAPEQTAPQATTTTRNFVSNGVSVVARNSCAPATFGFANVEAATRTALSAIFDTTCIEESYRTRIQNNLKAHGLDIRCSPSASLTKPGVCAESTGFYIPANILTLGSKSFTGHPDSNPGCQPLESVVLHEIVHLTQGAAQEQLPSSCEASCFGGGGGDPTLCRDIDVFGKRHPPGTQTQTQTQTQTS